MKDEKIVQLFLNRNEAALTETEKKYGNYLFKIAHNILKDLEDCKESVNDTYLKTWNSIPPNRPNVLSTYLGKIIREVSIDLFRKETSAKRGGTEYSYSISELEESLSKGNDTENVVEENLLAKAISDYLRCISAIQADIFVCRYYFADSIADISKYTGYSQAKLKSMLYRIRQGLKEHLESEGYYL